MEGFCRGCLTKYNDPMELLHYTEKYRRLFVYSTGLQVKRNDTITFQLCKDCFLCMKAACKFKKTCRSSDKKLKSYLALKDIGDGVEFNTFLKNSDEAMTFRLPLLTGSSTPANKNREDDNESTCTSIRNFMTDILEGEEMPDTEARIIREVIEEEADVLDESLDSHWLQDDASIDTDFRLDFSFSPYATPRSVNNDHCYTPKTFNDEREEQAAIKKYFTSISPTRHKIVNDFTDVIKNNLSEKELCIFEANKINDEDGGNNFDMPEIDTETITDFDMPANDGKAITHLDIPSIDSEKLKSFDLPPVDNEKSMNSLDIPSIPSIDSEKLRNNLDISMIDNEKSMSLDIPSFDIEKPINSIDLPSLPSLDNDRSMSNFDVPINDTENHGLNVKNVYISNDGTDYITTSEEIEKIVDGKVIHKLEKGKPCIIDQNLEKALEDENNQEIFLDDILITPKVQSCASVASTPTITNILFGDKLEMNGNGKNSKKYMDRENIEVILNEFLQSNTKEVLEKEELVEAEKDVFKVLMDVDEVDAGTYKKTKNNTIYSVYNETQCDLENFICKLCNIKYDNSKSLCMHFVKKHKIKIIKPISKAYKYKPRICPICGRQFRDLQNYHRHLKRHKKESEPPVIYKCELCDLEFSAQYKLDAHKSSHFNQKSRPIDPGRYVCTICGASSTTSSNYRMHQKRHTNNYSHTCEDCGKGFFRKSDLDIHMRLHTGEKPYTCTYCSRTFSRKDSLTKHVKFHIGDRPYKCEFCKSSYTTSSQLRTHLRDSMKCKKLRGIVDLEVKTELPEVEDEDENVELENNVNDTKGESELPYIDTEMSN